MPSLSALLKKRHKATANTSDTNAPYKLQREGSAPATLDGGTDKPKLARRRDSIFRTLLNKNKPDEPRIQSSVKAGAIPPISQPVLEKPVVVSPPVAPEKPLPSPPSPDVPATETQSMPEAVEGAASALTFEDIQKLFSGAPQFFVRSEGHHAGPPHPSVAFPWNIELDIRDLTDHAQLDDAAWSCCTTSPHIVRNPRPERKQEAEEHKDFKGPRFIARAKERPNMLSMKGLERGTVGFQAALETAVADALHESKELDASTVQKLRAKFLKDKHHGLRHLDEAAVLRMLVEIQKSTPARPTVEMYTELFTRLLHPPTRVLDPIDPYSYHVQIEALVNVLTAPDIWVDFSNVEWRIRLGQILWGPPFEPELDNTDKSGKDDLDKHETQRFWLLLQILLSCELLLRLDALVLLAQTKPKVITVEATHRFERTCTRPVKWSLLLARLWLDNINIHVPLVEVEEPDKRASGWLASIKHAVAGEHKHSHHVVAGIPEFHGRFQKRQMNGLVHFARKLRWPEAENVAERFAVASLEPDRNTESSRTTPTGGTPVVGTPLSMTTQRSSYFAGVGRPGIRRGLSQDKVSSMFYPAGWLSKSYLSGLVLPGEGLSHFLISTLLENDEVAVARLGEDANLYGGFVYGDRSYWSTACIIGRVLAAGKDVSECLGWLTSPVMPQGISEGWVNVKVELEPRSDGEKGPDSARIWKKKQVENDSYVLGDGDTDNILPQDFSLPTPDVRDPVNLEVKLLSLNLNAGSQATTPSARDTPSTEGTRAPHEILTYAAEMIFAIRGEDEDLREMSLLLSYDVQFVTAHPCVPSVYTNLVLEGTQGESADVAPNLDDNIRLRRPSGPHTLFTGHALHKSYNFSRHTLTSVVYTSPNSPPPLLSLHTDSNEVFVIDCTEPSPPEASVLDGHPVQSAYVARKRRFGSDLEMLARAWCSEKGYNALISRRGRNCIACSIREARALRWKIVLRFG